MRFQVGYQDNRRLVEFLLTHREKVSEVYFPWGDFTTGRGVIPNDAYKENLVTDLQSFTEHNIPLMLLLNGNCYGHRALARSFYQKLGDAVDYLSESFHLAGVTTASPLIARFLKTNFPKLEIRASVNMEIGTTEGVEYIKDYFDSFYLKREFNYDRNVILRMRDFCHANGKKLFLLANSGCLNFCSARTFHDNLVAHQHEVAEMDNAFEFHGECTVFLKKDDHRRELLSKTNFIRPEDVFRYEELCDGMKLATRTNYNPLAVVSAYFTGKWHGNLLDLTEPAHSAVLLPEIIDNSRIPADYEDRRMACPHDCKTCGYCRDVQTKATVALTDNQPSLTE